MLPSGVPRTQAVSSSTFKPPPLDGSLSPSEVYDWMFTNNKDYPLFVTPLPDAGGNRVSTWGVALLAVYRGVKYLEESFKRSENTGSCVVAVLSAGDTLTYFALYISIIRAGCVPFPISVRNSAAALAHLLQVANVKHIVVGREPGMQALFKTSLDLLGTSAPSARPPSSSTMPQFEDLYQGDLVLPSELPLPKNESSDPFALLHSSGSTSFPKVVSLSHSRWLEIAWTPWFGSQELTGKTLCLGGTPMYHGMGAMQTVWAASVGLILSTFDPKAASQFPTPDSVLQCAQRTDADMILCPPVFIEAWAKNQDIVQYLATRTGLLYGGGPLAKAVGDDLTSKGVTIFSVYGSTEAATISAILPSKDENHWEYFKISDHTNYRMIPQGNATYELVLLASQYDNPSVLNTKIDGVDAYATSDLFIEHPTMKNRWKILGRVDDQIMHSTGEKTNPGPLEGILNLHPKILSSVMFGRGRFQAGILVDPHPSIKVNFIDLAEKTEFLNEIWPTIEIMNAHAPQHSRIFKEMIIFSSPDKPFTYTVKMTPRKQHILQLYATEIDALYDLVEQSSNLPTSGPQSELDPQDPIQLVRMTVRSILQKEIGDEDDIFNHGCDSLQATQIRNVLLRALRDCDTVKFDTRQAATQNGFVYSHPSVSSLALFIQRFCDSSEPNAAYISSGDLIQAKTKEMVEMVETYFHELSLNVAALRRNKGDTAQARRGSEGEVVLVTGTTGQLGSSLLETLLKDLAVAKVYASNRPSVGASKVSPLERHRDGFLERGLDCALLSSEKLEFLETELHEANLGLDVEKYEEISNSVTCIIHNAWPVDFKLALPSFSRNIQGLCNLAVLSSSALAPQLLFTSTVGLFQNLSTISLPLTPHFPAAGVAAGSGYTESKWVAEQLLLKAHQELRCSVGIVRVGQLCGSPNGMWKKSEWLPSLVRSSRTLGCLPDDDRTVSWIPVDLAARAIVSQCRRTASAEIRITHLVHPKPIFWRDLVQPTAQTLGPNVEVVPFPTWLQKLERYLETNEADDRVPAAKLVGLFRVLAGRTGAAGYEAFGFPIVTGSPDVFQNIQGVRAVEVEDALEWIEGWESGRVAPARV